MNSRKIVCILLGFVIITLVSMHVLENVSGVAVGSEYTVEKWEIVEDFYCSQYNMEMNSKLVEKCGLLGCTTIELSFCTDGRKEKLIDHTDDLFCSLTLKGDWGWC